MKILRGLKLASLVVFGNLLLALLADETEVADDGFVSIFNGENFDGWYLKIRSGDEALAEKVFSAYDGVVHIFKDFPKEYELNTGENKTHGLFYTHKKYSRYIFRFEYKWGEGIANNFDQWQYDAGLYYHVVNDKIWPRGIEYQIRYDHTTDRNHTGDFIGPPLDWHTMDGQTFLPASEGGKKVRKGGLRRHARLDTPHNALNGKWNQCEVIVMSDKYTIHKLNGVIVNIGENLALKEGILGLQSETAEIFYRNLEIKEFDEDIPIEVFLE